MNKLSLSVIVPCKNEEEFLPLTLNALLKEKESNIFIKEIILVDNMSTDKSVLIAEKYDARIYTCEGTVSQVRNFGASKANGDFFCFIDADVEVKCGWGESIINCIKRRDGNPENSIFGYIYNIPSKSTWVEKIWHMNLIKRKNINYINGGNLIIHRSLFENLNGFSVDYDTGEDVNLCRRAAELGAVIISNNTLETVHHGYPKNIIEFYNRERWHGLGSWEC